MDNVSVVEVLEPSNQLREPLPALLLIHCAIRPDKVQKVPVLAELHENEVLVLPLQNAVNSDQIGMVHPAHDFHLSREELLEKVLWSCGTIDDLARQLLGLPGLCVLEVGKIHLQL